ncbi:MAG: hypothetical protein KKF48_01995 [Nanoarchaeota archaeon]|nr:hypothetical protein [Nanoarchaeota archaeon]MBU1027792.1 hypothetical protein [Nanoarchaeota archaeon]
MEIINIDKLPENGTKPISREALARCVELSSFLNDDSEFVSKIRNDNSFDVVLISSGFVENMKVTFAKYNGKIPLYDCYCGHTIEKIINQLSYTPQHYHNSFSSAVRLS